MRLIRADLHIHTALSPCGADEMSPAAVVAAALERGLEMIAICDHNTAGNVRAFQQAGEAAGLAVLAGMELATVEEVHVVGLFPDADRAERVAAQVRDLLPQADPGYYSFFGEQPLLAADGCRVGAETAALAYSTPLELNEAVGLIHRGEGLAVAAHVDRKSFSVLSQLGFVPEDAGFDALELSRFLTADSPRLAQLLALGLPVVGSSDGHFLEEIGQGLTALTAEAATFDELALALKGEGGRGTARVGLDGVVISSPAKGGGHA